MQELNSTALLFVFVRTGLESTLERSTIAREHLGKLLQQLVKTGTLPTSEYYKGSVWSHRGVVCMCRASLYPRSCFMNLKTRPLSFCVFPLIRLQEILELAEDMAIDIPHIWLYLSELIMPMLHEGGIPMGELFRQVIKVHSNSQSLKTDEEMKFVLFPTCD